MTDETGDAVRWDSMDAEARFLVGSKRAVVAFYVAEHVESN